LASFWRHRSVAGPARGERHGPSPYAVATRHHARRLGQPALATVAEARAHDGVRFVGRSR